MNRFQLVQVVVITLALWIGYETFTYVFLFFEEFAISLDRGMGQGVMIYGVNALVFTALFFLVIKKATAIATWVLTKTDLDPDVQLNLSAGAFLFGIVVFWAFKTVVESGADFTAYIAAKFFSDTVRYKSDTVFTRPMIGSFIKFIAGIVLLRYAKSFSIYLEKQTDENDPHQIIGDVATDNEPL